MDRRRAGLTAKATGLLFATLPVLALGLGLPALAGTLEQRRVVASLDRVSADFALARSSAILRREAVVVCPGAPATGCADGGDWSGGWLVFRDPDGNRRPDAPGDLLRVRAAPAAPDRLTLLASAGGIRYRPNGLASREHLAVNACSRGRLRAAVVVDGLGHVRLERPRPAQPCPPSHATP